MSEKRIYPVKNPEIVDQLQTDYIAKIEKNKASGKKAFLSGEFVPFKGYSAESMRTVFNVILELDDRSKEEITERVVGPLEDLAKQFSIPAIFAGRDDLPPHITLDVGIFKNLSPEQIQEAQQWLFSSYSHLTPIVRILEGLTFHMDTLVIAPNSFICVSQFDAEQGAPFKARKIIEKIMPRVLQRLGTQDTGSFAPPYRYDDILHSSVSRVTGKVSTEALTQFADEAYKVVGKSLQSNHLTVTVGSVFRGTAFEFMQKHTPSLLLAGRSS